MFVHVHLNLIMSLQRIIQVHKMVGIVVQIGPGLKKVQNMIAKLPKNLQKEISIKATKKIAESAQRRIIRQYISRGYNGTGFGRMQLGKKMTLSKSGNSMIYTMNIPGYLGMIEKGVSSHWVSAETISQHISSPGSTTGKRQPSGTVFSGPPIWWNWKGPFIGPAFANLHMDIPKILEKATAQALARSVR